MFSLSQEKKQGKDFPLLSAQSGIVFTTIILFR